MKCRMAIQVAETTVTHGVVTLTIFAVVAELNQNYFRLSACLFGWQVMRSISVGVRMFDHLAFERWLSNCHLGMHN